MVKIIGFISKCRRSHCIDIYAELLGRKGDGLEVEINIKGTGKKCIIKGYTVGVTRESNEMN